MYIEWLFNDYVCAPEELMDKFATNTELLRLPVFMNKKEDKFASKLNLFSDVYCDKQSSS